MKQVFYFLFLSFISVGVMSFTSVASKYVSTKSHIKFFSSTPAEDITANNYKAVGSLDTESGSIAFSVPMQGFEFPKALMQKHFNQEKFLDTKHFPKAKMTGKIINLEAIDFAKNGTYNTNVSGEMTIKGKTNPFTAKGTITVNGTELTINSKFNITLAEYGIEFVKGKPSKNIAKTVEVTIDAVFGPQ
ncbi:MAG: YceI family protein [Saprospiraceae bacterium]